MPRRGVKRNETQRKDVFFGAGKNNDFLVRKVVDSTYLEGKVFGARSKGEAGFVFFQRCRHIFFGEK